MKFNLCDDLKDSTKEDIQDVVGKTIENAIQGTFRIEIKTVKPGVIPVAAPALHLAYFVISKATFDVSPSGKIGNCKSIMAISNNPGADLCKLLKKRPLPLAKSATLIHLGVTFDFWVDGAEGQLIKEISWARPNSSRSPPRLASSPVGVSIL